MRWSRWEEVKQLGEGGQGRAYLVRDTDRVDVAALLEQLRGAILNASAAVMPHADNLRHATTALGIVEAYLTRDDDENVAVLKILHDAARKDPQALGRLRSEIEVLRRLDHPNLLTILEANPDEGWYVTPYYAEGTLAENLSQFVGRPDVALEALIPLVEGVAALHQLPAVHRDIKPENVFVSDDGRLILGDFGIAYFEDPGHTRLSETYENVGSRDWMPPWAMGVRLEEVRPSFDVFSLGKVLWAMISGRTKLRLWYFDRQPFDLRDQFPTDERILWIHRLLQGSVREEPEHVWRDANQMLSEMQKVARAVRRGGQVISRGVNRACRVCALGFYELLVAEENVAALNNLGFRPANERLRVFQCENCGHLDVFRVTFNPRAWGEIR